MAGEINELSQKMAGKLLISLKYGTNIETEVKSIPLNQLQMLVYMYAPQLKMIFEKLSRATNLHGKAMIEIIQIKTSGNDINPHAGKIINLNKEITIHCKELIEASANIVKNHFDKTAYFKERIKGICNAIKTHLSGKTHA